MTDTPALFRLRFQRESIVATLHADETWRSTDVIVQRLLEQGYTMSRVCEYVPLHHQPDPLLALAERAASHFRADLDDLRTHTHTDDEP